MAFKMKGWSPFTDRESRKARKAEKKIIKGKAALDAGKYEKAERKFRKAIKKDEWCVYYPSERNIFSMESKTGYDFRLWKEDILNGHNY